MGVVAGAPAVEPAQLLSCLNLPDPFSAVSLPKGDADRWAPACRPDAGPSGSEQDRSAGRAVPALKNFHYHTLVKMIRMRLYEEGCTAAQKGLALTTPGSFNWFKFRELFFLLCTNTGCYLKAYLLLEQTMQHPAFTTLDDHVQDEWIIYKAYLLFALYCDSAPYSFHRSTTLLDRLLQQVQSIPAERPLLSFSRLLLPMLLSLVRKDYEELYRHLALVRRDGAEVLRHPRRLSEVCRMMASLTEKVFGASAVCAVPPELNNSAKRVPVTALCERPAANFHHLAGRRISGILPVRPPRAQAGGHRVWYSGHFHPFPQIDIIPPEVLRCMILKFLS